MVSLLTTHEEDIRSKLTHSGTIRYHRKKEYRRRKNSSKIERIIMALNKKLGGILESEGKRSKKNARKKNGYISGGPFS